MGAISSCCKEEEEIKTQGAEAAEGSEFSAVAIDEKHINKGKFDQNLAPFAGDVVLLKFTSKSSYSEKFVWLNDSSKMIHMSEQHKNTENFEEIKMKRHKEANLSDVTSVIAGPPAKPGKNEDEAGNENKCLTVTFKLGGGIDLKFKTEKDRDLWYDMLNKVWDMTKDFK